MNWVSFELLLQILPPNPQTTDHSSSSKSLLLLLLPFVVLASSPSLRHGLGDPRFQVRIVLDSGDQVLTRDFERIQDDRQALDPVVPFEKVRVGRRREGNTGPKVAADPAAA